MPTKLARLTIALALCLAAALAAVAADREEPQEDRLFLDTVNVTVVNVDVYVTDRKGNRITGLTKDDFELYEDGRPVQITNFYAVEGGDPVTPVPESTRAAAEPADSGDPLILSVQEPSDPAVPEDQRLHLVVFIDNFNIQPFSRNRVMRELREFLRQNLDVGDRVMLVTYDRELHIRHPFTSDPSVIASALTDLETLSGHATHRESERRDALERIEQAESPQEAMSYAHTYAGSIYNDLAFTIDALKEMVDGVAGLPGRKAVLYVSEGIPMIAGEDLYTAAQQRFRDSISMTGIYEFDASRRFRELANKANTNRVTFYTIDAGGLRTYSYADASQSTAGQGVFVDQVYISNLQSPLQFLAEKTGGKAIINANRVLPSLEEVSQDFYTYYSLGYMPASYGDGRYHGLEVKVKDQKRLRVRHREGFRDRSPEAQMADGAFSALVHQYQRNTLGLDLGFGEPTQTPKGNYVVPVQVAVDLGKIALVPTDTMHEARLRLYFAVMDADGGMSEVQNQPLPISIPDEDLARARQQSYLYTVQLMMRKGPHRVALGVRDELASEHSFITRELVVGQ